MKNVEVYPRIQFVNWMLLLNQFFPNTVSTWNILKVYLKFSPNAVRETTLSLVAISFPHFELQQNDPKNNSAAKEIRFEDVVCKTCCNINENTYNTAYFKIFNNLFQ